MKSLTMLAILTLIAGIPSVFARQGNRPENWIDVVGHIVVPGTFPLFSPDEITLTFVDRQGRSIGDLTISGSTKTTSYTPSARGGLSGEVRLLDGGRFLLKVPPGEHRVLVRLRPSAKSNSPAYFVKAAAAGLTNILENPLVVNRPFTGDFVITLEKCADETRDRC
jgi:hypothetical protein